MSLGSESETIEFKKSTSELDEGVISISSILNKHYSGTLYFGVANNGNIVGQQITDETLRAISQKIKNAIKPTPSYSVLKIVLEDKNVVKVEFSGTSVPYSAAGRYYIRNADEDNFLPQDDLQRLVSENTEIRARWEKIPSELTIDDIDEDQLKLHYFKGKELKRFSGDYTNKEDILNKLNLITDGKINNAGKFLFSSLKPIILKLAVFASHEKITFLDMEEFRGNIFECIDCGITYISTKINWGVEIKGETRRDIPEIPIDAIREIVVNSFAHSNYNNIISHHEICIYANRITIYNPGRIPYNPDDEKISINKTKSILVNPIISNTLYKFGKIEAFGTGFRRTYDVCKELEIEFSCENIFRGVEFVFYRKGYITFEKDTIFLNKTQQKVLTLLKNSSITLAQISAKTGKSPRTITDAISFLKINGYIKREGPLNGGNWVVIKS